MFLSLNFVLNILLRMSVISLQFSFKNLSFKICRSGAAERAKKFLVRVRVVQAHSSWQCQTQGARGHERRPTSGDRRACGGLGV